MKTTKTDAKIWDHLRASILIKQNIFLLMSPLRIINLNVTLLKYKKQQFSDHLLIKHIVANDIDYTKNYNIS